MSDNEYGYGNSDYTTSVNAGMTIDGTVASSATSETGVKDITTAQFMSEVIEASRHQPVLVDFWAPWCGPCKQLAPALESAVSATAGKVKLVKMDIDQNPEVAGQMGIQSIPAVVAFVDGKPADMFMGAKPESEIKEFIAKFGGVNEQENQVEQALEHAKILEEQGSAEEATNLYTQILNFDPTNTKALSALGHINLKEGNLEDAKGLLAGVTDDALSDPDIVSLNSAIELAEQASELGDASELLAKLETDENDHQTRLDLAILLNASNKREDAANQLLEILRRDPDWNEAAARIQLLQFFEVWGLTDKVTLAARRRLSSMLFS